MKFLGLLHIHCFIDAFESVTLYRWKVTRIQCGVRVEEVDCFELIGSRVALAEKSADFEFPPVLPECFLTCEVLASCHLSSTLYLYLHSLFLVDLFKMAEGKQTKSAKDFTSKCEQFLL